MLIPKFPVLFKNMASINLTRKLIPTGILSFNFVNYPWETHILKHTVITRNHLTPELQLRLITPDCELWNCDGSDSPFPNDPFWGIYWPGGQALGRYILDNKELFHEKTVLDLGSGCGACALAAAKCGAKFVLANDIDPVSINAIHINSRLNNLTVHTYEKNLLEKDVDSIVIDKDNRLFQVDWNVILLGDMFYDSEFSYTLFIWLSKLVEKNKLVLIGDPGRHALKELQSVDNSHSLVKVAEYDLCNKAHNGFSNSSVYKVEPSAISSTVNFDKDFLT